MFNKILKLFSARYEFFIPKKKSIVFFDQEHVSFIAKKFKLKSKNFAIISSRMEVINFYILLKSLINRKITFSLANYYFEYIKLLNPKVVITLIDNNIFFYKLKTKFPNIKFISIQNGLRHESTDWWELLKKRKKRDILKADKYFTYSEKYGTEVKKFIDCKIVPVGNFRNNFVKIKKKVEKSSTLFISQYRDDHILKKDCFIIERRFLPILNKYCKNKNLKLNILGSSNKFFKKEKKYFEKILKSKNFRFFKRTKYPNNYKILDKFENIIFIDSSMGYEAIARKKKVAVFPLRKINLSSQFREFGWPYKIRNNFFMGQKITYPEVEKILNNVINLKQNIWEKNIYPSINKICLYNYQNLPIKRELKLIK